MIISVLPLIIRARNINVVGLVACQCQMSLSCIICIITVWWSSLEGAQLIINTCLGAGYPGLDTASMHAEGTREV